MTKDWAFKFLNLLVAACLVLSVISPACKFISGQEQSFIEICGAFGIEKIAVNADQLPFSTADADTQKSEESDHSNKDDCAFCFTQVHFSSLLLDVPVVPPIPTISEQVLALESAQPFLYEISSLRARGPPAILS